MSDTTRIIGERRKGTDEEVYSQRLETKVRTSFITSTSETYPYSLCSTQNFMTRALQTSTIAPQCESSIK